MSTRPSFAGSPHANFLFALNALEAPTRTIKPQLQPFLNDQNLRELIAAFTVLKAVNDAAAERAPQGLPCDWPGHLEHGEVCEDEFLSALRQIKSRLDAGTRSPANMAAIKSARNDLLAYRDLLVGAKNGSVQEYRRAFNESLDRLIDALGGQ